jgi:putative redox protein
MITVDCETETPNAFPQKLHVRGVHPLRADLVAPDSGDSAPGPHDYFDTALASCKALTATWFARRKGIPLERVEAHVDRDASRERAGVYALEVRLAFHGPLSEEQRTELTRAVAACPIHKLMTTSDIEVKTIIAPA